MNRYRSNLNKLLTNWNYIRIEKEKKKKEEEEKEWKIFFEKQKSPLYEVSKGVNVELSIIFTTKNFSILFFFLFFQLIWLVKVVSPSDLRPGVVGWISLMARCDWTMPTHFGGCTGASAATTEGAVVECPASAGRFVFEPRGFLSEAFPSPQPLYMDDSQVFRCG